MGRSFFHHTMSYPIKNMDETTASAGFTEYISVYTSHIVSYCSADWQHQHHATCIGSRLSLLSTRRSDSFWNIWKTEFQTSNCSENVIFDCMEMSPNCSENIIYPISMALQNVKVFVLHCTTLPGTMCANKMN